MPHNRKGRQLSRTASHRRAMLRHLVTSLFEHERVTTTVAKAKEARPVAERHHRKRQSFTFQRN